MDVGTPGQQKNMFRRLLNLEAMYVTFGARPPRGPGGMAFMVAGALIASIGTQKAVNRLK